MPAVTAGNPTGDRSSPELRLPTIAVPVRLALVGQAGVAAELFVADIVRRDRVHLFDDLSGLLDARGAAFVPVRIAGEVRMIAKRAMAWIAIERVDPAEVTLEELELHDREHRVEIELVAGNQPAQLHGSLLDSSPADHPRVIDHLNRSGAFLRLWTQDDHVWINRDHVVAVYERGQ